MAIPGHDDITPPHKIFVSGRPASAPQVTAGQGIALLLQSSLYIAIETLCYRTVLETFTSHGSPCAIPNGASNFELANLLL